MSLKDHAPTRLGRMFFWGGIALGVLLVAALYTKGFGWLGAGKVGEPAAALSRQGDRIIVPEGSPLRQRLTIAAASAQPVSVQLRLPAIVEADPARTAAVLPALAGRLTQLKVALGDRVKRGQALAVIDSADLGQAYDDNDKAADALKLAQRTLERQEGQFKIGAASEHDLDQARSDAAQARAEFVRTQARLSAIGAPLDASAQHPRLLTLTAPISGSITTLAVAPGNMINDTTQPLMTIADLSTIWVSAQVAEKDIAAAAVGLQADVSVAAYPDKHWQGTVLFVSDVLEPDSHRNKLRIAFPNSDYLLKPNMFASVVLSGAPQMRIVLPTSALLMNNDRTSVFVATKPWTFERRTVETQLEEGSAVTISSGLSAGEQVVVKGGILLND